MTKTEWMDLDKRYLSKKAQKFLEVTDPASSYEEIKAFNVSDYDKISKVFEDIDNEYHITDELEG